MKTINVTGLKQEQIEQLQQMITNFKNKNEADYNLGKNSVDCDIDNTIINDCNHKSCYDLAESLGIIGIAEDLPSDLSTNPDYLKGFGK